MKKNLVSVLAIAVLASVGLSGCSLFHSVEKYIEPTQISITKNPNFSYDNFTTQTFDALKGTEPFAVFIHNRNCGTCAKKHQQILNQANDLNGKILKLEYKNSPTDLLKQVGSTKYDTFVVFDKDGNSTVKRGASVNEVAKILQSYQPVNTDDTPAEKLETENHKEAVKNSTLAKTENFLYQVFDTETYHKLQGKENFAVFFHNKACGSCAKKNKQIIAEANQFKSGKILKLEFSEAPKDLLKQLGVPSYDTFVVFDKNGNKAVFKGGSVDTIRELL